MPRRIPLDTQTVPELVARTEYEIARLEQIAKQGFIGKQKLANSADSYLFMDGIVLKFFNATTGETKTVT